MWEFSLNLSNEELAKYLLSNIKVIVKQTGGVVTSHKENGYTRILIGVNEVSREQLEKTLSRFITEVICTYYKSSFLDKFLFLPQHDKMGVLAFKKALLNFDRETDYYIIQKNLSFESDLYLESFYEFKLKNLKNKWTELVALANENRDYLISADAFNDLLKFLVDNLDICEDEVNIIEDEEGYKIFLEMQNGERGQYQNKTFNDEGLISSIIDLSPQKINLYCNAVNNTTSLLERLYEQRIVVKTQCQFSQLKKQ